MSDDKQNALYINTLVIVSENIRLTVLMRFNFEDKLVIWFVGDCPNDAISRLC